MSAVLRLSVWRAISSSVAVWRSWSRRSETAIWSAANASTRVSTRFGSPCRAVAQGDDGPERDARPPRSGRGTADRRSRPGPGRRSLVCVRTQCAGSSPGVRTRLEMMLGWGGWPEPPPVSARTARLHARRRSRPAPDRPHRAPVPRSPVRPRPSTARSRASGSGRTACWPRRRAGLPRPRSHAGSRRAGRRRAPRTGTGRDRATPSGPRRRPRRWSQ